MTGGWKQKSGWIQIPPASGVPFTFPFLSQPSVCLIVSRVRAYLTTDQQHGIPCFLKRGPLPDWPVWTREQMISGDAAEREDGGRERERAISLTAHSPPRIRQSEHSRVLSLQCTQAIRERKPLGLSENQGAPPKIRVSPLLKSATLSETASG